MHRTIRLSKSEKPNHSKIYVLNGRLRALPKNLPVSKVIIQSQLDRSNHVFNVIEQNRECIIAVIPSDWLKLTKNRRNENLRLLGSKIINAIKKGPNSNVDVDFSHISDAMTYYIVEGIQLSDYAFNQLKTNVRKVKSKKQTINILGDKMTPKAFKDQKSLCDSVKQCRDLINLPLNHLNARQLAQHAKQMAAKTDIHVTILNKAKIQALKMGGLLSVNLGSPDPPTFTIMEYKPKKALNERPIIFVGKGVVYDTGGLSLKPTANSMDKMKIDMSGAAVVISSICAIAKLKLPYWIITLVPSTDNRPGKNAYVPGDVITMHSGLTVEVLNTDAEGRLLLADALHFAKKYNPELVIDYATLTGSAMRTLGKHGLTYMSTTDEKINQRFEQAGHDTHERYVNLPLWEEYDQYLKSDMADLKNIGGKTAGAITAAKFLEHFTDYPWIHVDMAGSPFFDKADGYHPKNGTGIGVRSLVQFIQSYK